MASVACNPNGFKRVKFTDGAGISRTIYVGKMSKAQADIIKTKVAEINAANSAGNPLTEESRIWLSRVSDKFYKKLAAVGLVDRRGSDTISSWLTKYIDGRLNMKPNAMRKMRQTEARLLAYFNPNTPLRKITREMASNWYSWLTNGTYPNVKEMGPLSAASAKIHAGNVKTIMKEAARRNLMSENVFDHLSSGVTATRNDRYVTPEDASKIIDECPSHTYRLIFGLARYAGLRVPSEAIILRWQDINWAKGRLTIRSPKTERYKGHEQRVAPIDPRLMTILTSAREAAPEGEELVLPINWSGHIHEKMVQVIQLAGVELWQDLFQTLRRSCEIEWATKHPQFAVSRWIGHSITISGRHYANSVPDEIFQQAILATQQTTLEPTISPDSSGEVSSVTDRRVCASVDNSNTLEENQELGNWRRRELNTLPTQASIDRNECGDPKNITSQIVSALPSLSTEILNQILEIIKQNRGGM